MKTRRTHDYSPLIPGTAEYNRAVQARREMISGFAAIPASNPTPPRWHSAMERSTGKPFPVPRYKTPTVPTRMREAFTKGIPALARW